MSSRLKKQGDKTTKVEERLELATLQLAKLREAKCCLPQRRRRPHP